MRTSRKSGVAALALSMASALVAISAHADPLQLSYAETNNGITNVITGSGTTTGLVVPGTYTYVNSHGALTSVITGSVSTSYPTGFEFYDDFIFTVAPASANSITSTINFADIFGISDLQVRLYNAAGQSSLPVLGTPIGGAIDAWSTAISAGPSSGTIAVLPTTPLLAGTYVLEVRGNVTGSSGGSYSGTLNVAPAVPLPGAIWLFGTAISGLMAARRRTAANA